jgi:hypothetical protein
MIGTVKILAISEDTEVRNLILSSLEFEGHKAICVTSPHEALQLLRRGLVADIRLIHAAKNRSKNLSSPRRFCKTSAAKNCASSPNGEIRQRQNQRFIGWPEGKCEPEYTNRTACVALWIRQTRQLTILRDLQRFRLVWKLHPCDGNESKGLLALPAGLNAPHRPLGLIFPNMISRADPSAVRFERGGRVGVFYVQSLGNARVYRKPSFVRSPEELARLCLRDVAFTSWRGVYERDQRIDYAYFPTTSVVSTQRAMVRQLKWFSQEMTE